jgi:hypothetical protein
MRTTVDVPDELYRQAKIPSFSPLYRPGGAVLIPPPRGGPAKEDRPDFDCERPVFVVRTDKERRRNISYLMQTR